METGSSHEDDGRALVSLQKHCFWHVPPVCPSLKAWLAPLNSSHHEHLQKTEMEKPEASSPVVCGPSHCLGDKGIPAVAINIQW